MMIDSALSGVRRITATDVEIWPVYWRSAIPESDSSMSSLQRLRMMCIRMDRRGRRKLQMATLYRTTSCKFVGQNEELLAKLSWRTGMVRVHMKFPPLLNSKVNMHIRDDQNMVRK